MQDTQTHIGSSGLWIPPELREFDEQVVFRTPKGTIQHFGTKPLDAHYGLIGERDFGPSSKFNPPKNPDLAPDEVSIKRQGEEPVVLTVETDRAVRCDGGFDVEQRGLDGEPAEGQTTLDGGIVRERGDE